MKDAARATGDDIYLSPIDVQTLADQATIRLRNAIERGSLRPGLQLVERDLAQRLGMSRVPIREAIQRLVEEGLVKKLPHRGTFVYLPSPEEIEEICSLRIVLEWFVIERVMARWNAEHEAALEAVLDELREAAMNQERHRMSELDAQFHNLMWEIADHNILLEVVSSLRKRVTRLLYETISLMPTERLFEAVTSHETLIGVIKSGDVAEAKAEMSRHIEGARDRILIYRERNFAEFDGHAPASLAADGLAEKFTDGSNVLA